VGISLWVVLTAASSRLLSVEERQREWTRVSEDFKSAYDYCSIRESLAHTQWGTAARLERRCESEEEEEEVQFSPERIRTEE